MSGYITAGLGLLAAGRMGGQKSLPVNYQDYESEEQEFADLVADNSIAAWAEAVKIETPSVKMVK